MMVFDPLFAEGLLVSEIPMAAVIASHPDSIGNWIPILIGGRPGFILRNSDGLSGEYRSSLGPREKVLDVAPVEINPTAPVTLQRLLREQLDAWVVEPGQEAARAVIARLADPAYAPMVPQLRDTVMSFMQNASAGLEGLKKQIERHFADCTAAHAAFELGGREYALVLAFTVVANTLIDGAIGDGREHDPAKRHQVATILLRALPWGSNPTSDASLGMLLDSMGNAQLAHVIRAQVEHFESHVNQAFEEAKATGVDSDCSAEQASERVCADFRYAMAMWNDMHHALRTLLPFAYAGQVLARFLNDRVALPEELAERMRFAYKQLDETTVVIMTSLAHAVRMHDPRTRTMEMMLIRQAREQGGDRAARAVVRSLIEQQAFYPRSWTRWLDQASRPA